MPSRRGGLTKGVRNGVGDRAHRRRVRGLLVRSSERTHATRRRPRGGGAAGGAGHATNAPFRRRDWAWRVGFGVLAVVILFWIFGGDDTPTSATETEEAAATTETISGPLSFGDSGADVALLQESLADEGLPVTVDGVYGQETVD